VRRRHHRRHHHGPAKRLLILPALLLVVLVVGLHQVDALHPRPLDPTLRVEPEEVAARPIRCERTDPASVDRAAATMPPEGRISSALVLACPAAYDGHRVRYVGELIGDLLHRDGGAWVLVNDDAYALEVGPLPGHRDLRGTNSGLTVWLPDPLLEAVTGLGRPNQRGDVIEVTGVVVRADPADGEGLTLRADRLRLVAPARAVDEPLDRPQLWFALGASLLAAGLWVMRRRAERR
jgi:hypothetical protein